MNTRPYELYVSLDELIPLWQSASDCSTERQLRAALVSIELTGLLVRDALDDPRSASRKSLRIRRLVEGLRTQTDLLARLDLTLPPRPIAGSDYSTRSSLYALTGLEPAASRHLKPWADALLSVSEDWACDHGLEFFARSIRADAGFDSPAPSGRAILDYDALAQPDTVRELFERRTYNVEDRIFATVHQICECWFAIARMQLEQAYAYTAQNRWQNAGDAILLAEDIMAYMNEHVLLLETMVMADYHPLRVRLRDASGAQSKQAHALVGLTKSLMAPGLRALAKDGSSLLDVQRDPATFADYFAYFEALDTMGIRMSTFFFNHYKLAARVLGIESLGSLGYEVQALTNRFVKPFFPELDAVRYGHSTITSFEDGLYAGHLVSELERTEHAQRSPLLPAVGATRPDLMHASGDGHGFGSISMAPIGRAASGTPLQTVVDRYFEAIQGYDLEGWVELFAPDGWIEDPVGSRPYVTHGGLRIFFRNFMKAFSTDLEMTCTSLHVDEQTRTARAEWTVSAKHRAFPISFAGREEFSFGPDGLIEYVRVYHDPEQIGRQLADAYTAHFRTAVQQGTAPKRPHRSSRPRRA